MRQVDQFLAEWRARGRSPRTLDLYRKVLGAFAAWLDAEDLGLQAFTVDTLHRYREGLIQRGLRPKSVTTYLSVLHVFAAWLGVAGELEGFDWHRHCSTRSYRATPLTRLLWQELTRRGLTVGDLSRDTGLPTRRLMLFLRGQQAPDEAECAVLAPALGRPLAEIQRMAGLRPGETGGND